ncbi:acyl-CoA dehydrogenase family protein [Nocardioides rubriscoriae]|uniref:acyl-CoA dehydrogenase family protein n=1 Tax=Nocardioides rubriscoriae TaxID=642762 RepID=UPI0011DF91BF|nr:acyl-CoA dehydrogenase family protein [Nocardioides rubriscoriae]
MSTTQVHSFPVLRAIEERADEIAALGPQNEAAGQLTDETVRLLREARVIKMLQPASHGGLETHPREWAEATMKLGSLDGATGWISGIVGVHPWEMAFADPRVQDEVWGNDDDVWVGSPYAPMGVLKPVGGPDDGYEFSGRWQFSSGTDHCDWLFLGALLGDADGVPLLDPPQLIHVLIPRSDYTIVPDSWDVVGLKGTGSKDVIVDKAHIPSYRTVTYDSLVDGSAWRDRGLTNPLYQMPFSAIFPLGITSAVIGMAEGALAHHMAYQRSRVQITGRKVKDDPYVMSAIAEAAADIHASRVALLDGVSRMYDAVATGKEYEFGERSLSRRNQVAAAHRAVRAVDDIVARSGGNGMRMDHPLQRFWRDIHMGQVHAIHVPGLVYHASSLSMIDVEAPGYMRPMI